MEDRFVKFSINIAKLHKLIQKLKTDGMKQFDLKGTHTLCIYQLLTHAEGMTSTEMAASCDLDPALISRTLASLTESQIVCRMGESGKYFAKYVLTPKGNAVAKEIQTLVHAIQEIADTGISEEELIVFYRVLGKLADNLQTLPPDLL